MWNKENLQENEINELFDEITATQDNQYRQVTLSGQQKRVRLVYTANFLVAKIATIS